MLGYAFFSPGPSIGYAKHTKHTPGFATNLDGRIIPGFLYIRGLEFTHWGVVEISFYRKHFYYFDHFKSFLIFNLDIGISKTETFLKISFGCRHF